MIDLHYKQSNIWVTIVHRWQYTETNLTVSFGFVSFNVLSVGVFSFDVLSVGVVFGGKNLKLGEITKLKNAKSFEISSTEID